MATFCETHPDREALGACTSCGRFICGACNRGGARLLCHPCAIRLDPGHARPPGPASVPQVVINPPPVASFRLATPAGALVAARRPQTRASALAWMPVLAGCLGLTSAIAFGWIVGLTVGLPVLAGSVWGGLRLRRMHRRELFEQRALEVFRRHRGATMTKESVVREHAIHPDEAEEILKWLVGQELLVADWTDLEGPIVYRRGDA